MFRDAKDVCLLYFTASSREEAEKLARLLVEQRFVACVNILGDIASLYWWEGRVQEGAELALLAKTRAEKAEAAVAAIRAAHSYDCPAILVLPVAGGNPDFLRWVEAETAGSV